MKPLMLIILDGWGLRTEREHNGIALARTPNYSHYLQEYPWTAIDASGPAVGLPPGIMGNSEVGHMNIGAGRIVYQGLSKIFHAIEDGSFFTNPKLLQAMAACRGEPMCSPPRDGQTHGSAPTLHLMGLLSDGAVHSHQDHLYALLRMAKQQGVQDVAIHCFLDGRDTAPTSGVGYLKQLEAKIQEIGIGRIATVIGRYYAMDRDKRQDRTQKAYDLIVNGKGHRVSVGVQNFEPLHKTIEEFYQKGITDEFMEPIIIPIHDTRYTHNEIKEDDGVIFFNFRADRARQITQALTDPNFVAFPGLVGAYCNTPLHGPFVCMMEYAPDFHLPYAFDKTKVSKIFPEIISQQGLKQIRIAETEKYAHVTYFFNGGEDKIFPGEDRAMVPSNRSVATYDKSPEMSAQGITEQALRAIEQDYDFILINFANPDMVGHTALEPAIIKAVETVDNSLGKIVEAVLAKDGTIIITADHGNCEETVDTNGQPHTQHTTNLVPFILIGDQYRIVGAPLGAPHSRDRAQQAAPLQNTGGRLCDIAPTLLKILNLPQPPEMTGQSLLQT